MKNENRPNEDVVITSSISADDFEYRRLEKRLEKLEQKLLGVLGDRGRDVMLQYKQAQENITLYLIAKGVEIGLQSGDTVTQENVPQRERFVQ